jgi:hypothetical protein
MIEARGGTGAHPADLLRFDGRIRHAQQRDGDAPTLLGQLSPALKAFYDATATWASRTGVTTFTLVRFGRTFQPAAGGGSDHAWGNHHIVMGGAVRAARSTGSSRKLAWRAERRQRRKAAGFRRRRSSNTDGNVERQWFRRRSGCASQRSSRISAPSRRRTRIPRARRRPSGRYRPDDGKAPWLATWVCCAPQRQFGGEWPGRVLLAVLVGWEMKRSESAHEAARARRCPIADERHTVRLASGAVSSRTAEKRTAGSRCRGPAPIARRRVRPVGGTTRRNGGKPGFV